MLIGYDGRFLTEKPTGNGVYAISLIRSLSLLDDGNTYRLYVTGRDLAVPEGLGENVEVLEMHPLHRSAWLRVPLLFPWELRRRPVDIFHAHYTVPLGIRARVVLTLHDFFWIVYPKQFVSFKRVPVTWAVRKSVVRADRILVGTSFIKSETIKYFGVPEDRFEVIPYGHDPKFDRIVDQAEIAGVRRKYGVVGPYILAVGDMHPRKNLERLFEAFLDLSQSEDVRLVLVGKPLWRAKRLFDRIRTAGLESRVIATGYVSDEDMPALYQGAEVFCYPSLYEGFGFPVVEAMASGVPVAVSEASSCPEVGGEAVEYFDPMRMDSMAEVLRRLLLDSELRCKLKEAGRKRAMQFTWERTASRTIRAYCSLQ
jgi:glycosyltransferase involved in cell wall biosynthesis